MEDLGRAVDFELRVGLLHLDAGPLLLDAGILRLSAAHEEEYGCERTADEKINAVGQQHPSRWTHGLKRHLLCSLR